jgi:uncharacterized Zn-finger protein
MAQPAASSQPIVEVTERDLPLHCPNPAMPLWSSHPRVFLELGAGGEAMCPYCGTRYRLKGGARKPSH